MSEFFIIYHYFDVYANYTLTHLTAYTAHVPATFCCLFLYFLAFFYDSYHKPKL